MMNRNDRSSWAWQDRKMIKEHRAAGQPWWVIEQVIVFRNVEPERTKLALEIMDQMEEKDARSFG